MAVRILNDLPDAAVSRGDRAPSLADWTPRTSKSRSTGRPVFIAVTGGLHLLAILGFLSIRHVTRTQVTPAPIEASIIDEVRTSDDAPPLTPPSMAEVIYTLPVPEQLSFEAETVSAPQIVSHAIAQPSEAVAPPLVESVEYLRAPSPQYPRESSRRREYGTVVLRVLVDAMGRPAQIQVERSSGYERLDLAARVAVEKALFRPHEVAGVAQASQVLVPIEFLRRAT